MDRTIRTAAAMLALCAVVAWGATTYVIANRQGVDGNAAWPAESLPQGIWANAVYWLPAPSDTTTNFYDYSTGANDFNATNGIIPAWKALWGGHLYFDGVDDTINVDGVMPTGADQRTQMVWARFLESSADPALIFISDNTEGSTGQRWVGAYEDDAVSLGFSGHRLITPKSALSTNVWYHIAFVVPAGATATADVLIYIDGIVQALSNEAGSSQTLNTTTDNFDLEDLVEYRLGLALGFNRALTSNELFTAATRPATLTRYDK